MKKMIITTIFSFQIHYYTVTESINKTVTWPLTEAISKFIS